MTPWFVLKDAARVLSGRDTLTPVQLPPHFRIAGRTVVVRALACWLGMMATAAWVSAGEPEKRKFDVPADLADKSLRVFSVQSGSEVLFSSDAASGVRTNAIKGYFLPGEAVQRMLAGTPLYVRDEREGVFRIAATPRPKAPGAALSPGQSDRPGEAKSGAHSRDPPPGATATTQPNPLQISQPQRKESSAVKNRSLFSFLAGWLAAGPATYVQAAPAGSSGLPAGDAITELSPFVVSATADIGYVGAQSLLGSRFRQELRDIPAQIEVFTPEFLLDFDLTRAEEAFKYSVNVENSQEFISPADGGDVVWNSQTSGRIRGLLPASMSVSRELFSSITTADTYNLDRFELASGAQSLLFSLGEPAGMANMSLKRAQMKDRGEVMMRLDTESGHRVTFDYNKILLTKRPAALRVAFVNENRPQFMKPSHDRNTRVYGASTLQPFPKTTIRVNAERTWEDSNRPIPQLPWDFATPFFIAKADGTLSTLSTAGAGAVQQSPLLIYGANASPMQYLHWRLQAYPAGPQKLPLNPATYGAALDPNSGATRVTFNPGNISLVPFAAQNIGRNFMGENFQNKVDSHIFQFIAEQRITDNLRLEVGGHIEKWDRRQQSMASYTRFAIYADANEYLPIVPYVTSTTAPDFAKNISVNQSYIKNPNYGKIFVPGQPSLSKANKETEEYRASVSWDPDLRRYWKWLGSHSLLGSLTTRTTSSKAQSASVRMDNPTVKYQSLNSFAINDARRVLNTIFYLDAQHSIATPPPGMSFGQVFSGFNYTEPTTGEVLHFSGWDATTAATPTGSKVKIDSTILAWQGRFLNDRLNVGYGRRLDHVKSFRLSTDRVEGVTWETPAAAWRWYDKPEIGWNSVPSIVQTKTSSTYGGIVRPWRWLSLSYYQSATFSLATGNFTPFGDPLPGIEGRSKDHGARVDFLGGRLFIKVNAYDVAQVGNIVSGSLPVNAQREEQSYAAVLNNNANQKGGLDYDRTIEQQGFAGGVTSHSLMGFYPMTGSTLSKGLELTAGTRVGRLDVRLTGAKTDAKTGGVASTWAEWVAARQPYWEKVVDANGRGWDQIPFQGNNPENFIFRDPLTGLNRVRTMKEFFNDVVLTDLAAAQASNGKPVDTGRKYRVNLNLAYSFNGGHLRGVRVGGALIYRSAPVLGFGVRPLTVPGQQYPTPLLDFGRPYYGRGEVNVDAFVAYAGKNFLGSGKAWRVQVNGSNLLTGEYEFRNGKVNAYGQSIFTVIETPRAGSATLVFDF